jgi:glycosyltransferase involved in cell wall biosynthesis
MNILWLSWKDPLHPDAGGAEHYGEHFTKHWHQNLGYHIKWVSSGYKNSQKIVEQDGITYERVGSKWMVYCGFWHALIAWNYLTKWRKNYDIIIDEIHGAPLLTPLYAHKPRITIIHEVAAEIWNKMFPVPIAIFGRYIVEPFFLQFYKKEKFIVGSQSTKDDITSLGIPSENINIITYGAVYPDIPLSQIEKSQPPELVYLSDLRAMKGFERVYEAITLVKKELPEIKLHVVGDDSTEYAQKIKDRINKDKNNNWIIFHGRLKGDKKFEILKSSRIFLHGSYKEGWGIVVIEANAVGTPAVVYDAAGLRYSVKNEHTGYIVQSKQEYAEKVLQLLKNNTQYKTMQANAYQWSREYTWEKAITKATNLLEQIKQ